MKKRKKSKGKRSTYRRLLLKLGVALLALLALFCTAGDWFVHHSLKWIDEQPDLLAKPLLWIGNPVADLTDALDWTGYDTVCEYDEEAPVGTVTFAGAPVRTGSPAPADIRVLDRGEFQIGWSDSLKHPVWCAYHVVRDAHHEVFNRPGFTKDKAVPLAPSPDAYTKSGYDRGHMVPNFAIATRYGEDEQKKTFRMSNIAPQSPALNRGVWRDVEHRIAQLWTARYGEIWVVVGCLSGNTRSGQTLSGTNIDVPESYYQVIVAQDGLDVRMLAVIFDQSVGWDAWAARHIVTVDELERLTGLDFNPELPSFIQDPLESDLPNRLWPIRARDVFRLISLWFN